MTATHTPPRGLRLTTVALILSAAAVLAAVAGLLLTGASQSLALADPGALTRWGLPVARALNDVAACLTVGLLVLAAVALPPNGTGRQRVSAAERAEGSPLLNGTALAVVRLAGATALVWAAA